MICQKCGLAHAGDVRWPCPRCGHTTGAPGPVVAASPPGPSPQRPGAPGSHTAVLVVAGVALALLLVGALIVGALVLPDRQGDGSSASATAPAATSAPSADPSPPPPREDSPAPEPRPTPVTVRPLLASASCQSEPSVDDAGDTVAYGPMNAVDGDASTAWRCAGDASGESLSLLLSSDAPIDVTELGLIPGYAKVDAVSGVDRFRQNRSITKVEWDLVGKDGSVLESVDQDIAAPSARMVWLRLPAPVSAHLVRLTILETAPGSDRDNARDFTPVSEVAFRRSPPDRI